MVDVPDGSDVKMRLVPLKGRHGTHRSWKPSVLVAGWIFTAVTFVQGERRSAGSYHGGHDSSIVTNHDPVTSAVS